MIAVLRNGDYVPNGAGGFLRADGAEGLLNEALFRLGCRTGGFALIPGLGSELYLLGREKPSARNMVARQYAQDALEGLAVTVEDVEVTMLENGIARVLVTMTAEGETVSVEVTG